MPVPSLSLPGHLQQNWASKKKKKICPCLVRTSLVQRTNRRRLHPLLLPGHPRLPWQVGVKVNLLSQHGQEAANGVDCRGGHIYP